MEYPKIIKSILLLALIRATALEQCYVGKFALLSILMFYLSLAQQLWVLVLNFIGIDY